MRANAILVQGEFNEKEIGEILAVLRHIEQRHPERDYHLMTNSGDNEDASQIQTAVERIWPDGEGVVPHFNFVPREK